MAVKKCLVVEDHLPTSNAVVDYLRSFFPDWRISQAVSEKEGLRKTLKERPDVVILDITLPDGDGLDIVRELARSHPEAKPRFVVITALGEKAFQSSRPERPWLEQLEPKERALVAAFFQRPFLWKEFLIALAGAADVPAPH